MSKKSLVSLSRSLSIAASLTALALAAACAKGGGSARVSTKGPVDSKAETNSVLTKAFNGKYNSNDEENMKLARKIEGATASAALSAQASADGKKIFDVTARILVGEENKNQPALIVEVAGQVAAGTAPVAAADSEVTPAEKQKGVTPDGFKLLKFVGETSEEASKRFFVYGVCADDACSNLAIMLKELSQTDSADKKLVSKPRRTAFHFKRKANVDPSVDPSMTLVWSGNVDAKNINGGTKQSFEIAADSRNKQGLPIAAKTPETASQLPGQPAPQPSATPTVNSGDGQAPAKSEVAPSADATTIVDPQSQPVDPTAAAQANPLVEVAPVEAAK